MPRAFSISTESIAAEQKRVAGNPDAFDISRVVKLDDARAAPDRPGDVHLRILAVSGEHNINHAALADTVNIADVRGGKIYPGNSAVGEVIGVGANVTKFKAGDIVDHALQRRARHLRLPAAHLGLRPARLDRLVRRGGDGRRVAARAARRSSAGSTSGRSPRCRCARRPRITCGAARSASTD